MSLPRIQIQYRSVILPPEFYRKETMNQKTTHQGTMITKQERQLLLTTFRKICRHKAYLGRYKITTWIPPKRGTMLKNTLSVRDVAVWCFVQGWTIAKTKKPNR